MTGIYVAIGTTAWAALSVAVSPLIGKLICPKIHDRAPLRDEYARLARLRERAS